MHWTHWIVCSGRGLDTFTPFEPNPDGSVNIVYGFALMTDIDDVIKGGALKIVRVDDEYELTNPRVVYPADGAERGGVEDATGTTPETGAT